MIKYMHNSFLVRLQNLREPEPSNTKVSDIRDRTHAAHTSAGDVGTGFTWMIQNDCSKLTHIVDHVEVIGSNKFNNGAKILISLHLLRVQCAIIFKDVQHCSKMTQFFGFIAVLAEGERRNRPLSSLQPATKQSPAFRE